MLHLEQFLKKTQIAVNAELEKFFPRAITKKWAQASLGYPEFEFDIHSSQKAVAEPIWDFLDRGGKRWRPALMLLSCEAAGGSANKALPYTVIPELAHNGTIMVDDVEDNSTLRRGKPATHLLYGSDIAINAGNALYYVPLAKLFNSKLSPKIKSRMYDVYSKEMLRLSFGQAMDIYWHQGKGNVTEKHYLQMCSYKTGCLARMAAELGAILGGANEKTTLALGDFAATIGVAFQIQDDILNIKPEDSAWGKEIGDDIKEGKRTLMVIHALEKLPQEKRAQLTAILDSRENSPQDVAQAIELLESCGAVDYARKIARSLVEKSWKNVDKKLKKSKSKLLLKEFADYLINRKI